MKARALLKVAPLVLLFVLVFVPLRSFAQDDQAQPDFTPTDIPNQAVVTTYAKGTVIDVTDDTQTIASQKVDTQKVKVRITSGAEKGKEVVLQFGGNFSSDNQKLYKGERIVITKTTFNGQDQYAVGDLYRLPAIVGIAVFFVVAILIFGKWRGLTSLFSLGISFLVIVEFLVPQILKGRSPLLFSIITTMFLAVVTIYLAHGFKKRSTASVVSTLITLLFACGISVGSIYLAHLFGGGTEETFSLQFTGGANVDLRGLLMGGIIIGMLGILDDVTMGQASALDELKQANPNFTFKDLVKRGISLGQEHIASLVNTLFLIYAGASLAILLILKVSPQQPLWTIVNSEFFSEEIVRTLAGSITLVLAVPIATFVSAYIFTMKKKPHVARKYPFKKAEKI